MANATEQLIALLKTITINDGLIKLLTPLPENFI
jgi:hypothetical protein